jgi:hypothetical protein
MKPESKNIIKTTDESSVPIRSACTAGYAASPRIICAAVWFQDGKKYTHQPKNIETGIVVTGWRHHNCFYTAYALQNFDLNKRRPKNIQGFLTSDNKFLTRNKAFVLARKTGQVGNKHGRQELASEDLY